MKALCAELEPEFGAAKVFRPYRDVRFAKDKTPYKTHQGAFVGAGPSTGWYVEISPRGTRVGAGFYEASGPRLAAIREAMADDRSGRALDRLLTRLEKDGWEIGGEELKTAPRGLRQGPPADPPAAAQAGHRRPVLRLRGRRHRPRPASTGCGPTGVPCARSSPG